MEKNTGNAIRTTRNPPQRRSKAVLGIVLLFTASATAAEQLVDQTLAMVGKRVVTLHDVTTAFVVAALLEHKRPDGVENVRANGDVLEQARQALVKKALIRTYLNTTGLSTSIPKETLESLRSRATEPFSGSAERDAFLRKNGVSDDDLDQALLDTAYSEDFFRKHFSLRTPISEERVKGFYLQEKDRRFLDKPFTSVAGIARETLRREELEVEFRAWLQAEMRRTEVVFLPLQAP